MKARILCFHACKTFLPAVLLVELMSLLFVSSAGAQNLTLNFQFPSRRILVPFYATDYHPLFNGSYQDQFFTSTNVAGTFNIDGTEATPFDFTDVSAACNASQNSTITATATNLSITGQVEISASGSVFSSHDSGGGGSWSGLSELYIGFTIDHPFAYSLQVTTAMNTNATETVPIAFAGLAHNGDNPSGLPDIVAYGSTTFPGDTATAPSASGTSTGVFTNGTYYFIARVHSSSGVDEVNRPMSEHFLVTFNLSVTYIPPQPPGIVTFAPNGDGTFNLIWTAPQAGNYRVLSSTNLTDWAELVPAASELSGLNTNVVSAVSGSDQGFFRVEYQP
jgi:hypothetical protein